MDAYGTDLYIPQILVFDLETRKLSDEVGGWDAVRQGKAGISAVAIYDSDDDRTHLYDDHTITDCAAHLESADIIVGYNSIGFDIPIIEGVLGRKLRLKSHIDILVLIWNALRHRGESRFKGNKLNDVGLRTLGRGKIEHGADAPALAREGQWARLFNYCMDDVDLTRELFEHIRREKGVTDVTGNFLLLDIPPYLWLDSLEAT